MKFIAIESGGDWTDASVDYIVAIKQFDLDSVKETYNSLSNEDKRLHGFSLAKYLVNLEYCRELNEDDELDIISDF